MFDEKKPEPEPAPPPPKPVVKKRRPSQADLMDVMDDLADSEDLDAILGKQEIPKAAGGSQPGGPQRRKSGEVDELMHSMHKRVQVAQRKQSQADLSTLLKEHPELAPSPAKKEQLDIKSETEMINALINKKKGDESFSANKEKAQKESFNKPQHSSSKKPTGHTSKREHLDGDQHHLPTKSKPDHAARSTKDVYTASASSSNSVLSVAAASGKEDRAAEVKFTSEERAPAAAKPMSSKPNAKLRATAKAAATVAGGRFVTEEEWAKLNASASKESELEAQVKKLRTLLTVGQTAGTQERPFERTGEKAARRASSHDIPGAHLAAQQLPEKPAREKSERQPRSLMQSVCHAPARPAPKPLPP